jgi:hypothetical protein
MPTNDIGIPDETRTLGEGEIFCQVIIENTHLHKIVEGPCTVFRNPCRMLLPLKANTTHDSRDA